MRAFAFVTVISAIAFAGAAHAGSMDARFGNTVVVSQPNGTTFLVWYDPDGSFKGEVTPPGGTATALSGKWRVDGDQLCLTSNGDLGRFKAGTESCAPLLGDKVGDKWESPATGADGEVVIQQVEITAGR